MKRHFLLRPVPLCGLLMALAPALTGCGYSTRSALPSNLRRIHIEPFKNKIDFTDLDRRNLYFPLLEVDVRNAVIDRFVFDGAMRIAEPENANLILKGELIGYNRYALRYTDNDDVEEYRVQITVNLVMMDVALNEPMWTENGFVGEADYFVTGPLAKTEQDVIGEAITDLARRIVERTIENW